MQVTVLFFGATADVVGTREAAFEVPDGADARQAFESIVAAHPKLAEHKLLFAVNQEYALGPEPVNDGDELALFTAVSGG